MTFWSLLFVHFIFILSSCPTLYISGIFVYARTFVIGISVSGAETETILPVSVFTSAIVGAGVSYSMEMVSVGDIFSGTGIRSACGSFIDSVEVGCDSSEVVASVEACPVRGKTLSVGSNGVDSDCSEVVAVCSTAGISAEVVEMSDEAVACPQSIEVELAKDERSRSDVSEVMTSPSPTASSTVANMEKTILENEFQKFAKKLEFLFFIDSANASDSLDLPASRDIIDNFFLSVFVSLSVFIGEETFSSPPLFFNIDIFMLLALLGISMKCWLLFIKDAPSMVFVHLTGSPATDTIWLRVKFLIIDSLIF